MDGCFFSQILKYRLIHPGTRAPRSCCSDQVAVGFLWTESQDNLEAIIDSDFWTNCVAFASAQYSAQISSSQRKPLRALVGLCGRLAEYPRYSAAQKSIKKASVRATHISLARLVTIWWSQRCLLEVENCSAVHLEVLLLWLWIYISSRFHDLMCFFFTKSQKRTCTRCELHRTLKVDTLMSRPTGNDGARDQCAGISTRQVTSADTLERHSRNLQKMFCLFSSPKTFYPEPLSVQAAVSSIQIDEQPTNMSHSVSQKLFRLFQNSIRHCNCFDFHCGQWVLDGVFYCVSGQQDGGTSRGWAQSCAVANWLRLLAWWISLCRSSK